MFIYWNGYEIDGSDTDFNIVLPENVQLCELVDCFLNLPLFDKNVKPHIYCKQKHMTYEKIIEMLTSGIYPDFGISMNCCHIEELEEDFRKKIYDISARRNPHEDAYEKVENPCTAPLKQKNFIAGGMTVTLLIGHETVSGESAELNGYMTNIELLQDKDCVFPCVSLSVGPSFYYEYAIYIVDYLREHFPSVATFGGLDCQGGWTDGCTYASSLYFYEMIELAVKYNIKNTLKRLCEYDILRTSLHYYQKGWKLEHTNKFYLSKDLPSYIDAKGKNNLKFLSFDEYVEFAEQILSSDKSCFEMVCKTALEVMLSKPENFSYCKSVQKTLEDIYASCDVPKNDWYQKCYFCFTKREGKIIAQFRVYYKFKPYFNTLLELLEAGELEEIKRERYRQRHEE